MAACPGHFLHVSGTSALKFLLIGMGGNHEQPAKPKSMKEIDLGLS
jgi:hypothetical protein